MVEYNRNPTDLKQAIREHSISGYRLTVPFFDSAKGISTSSTRGLTGVLVEPVRPLPIDELALRSGWSKEKKNLAQWQDYGKFRYPNSPLGWMHPHSLAMLEDGYSVSMRDIQEAWLRALGHLDQDGMVRKYSFNLKDVTIDSEDVQPGMIVEFYDKQSKTSTVGRVYSKGRDSKDGTDIIYLESFAPVPSLRAPKAMAPWMLNETMISDKTWALGSGTVQAMKNKRLKVPLGMFDPKDDPDELRPYFLDQPIPIAKVQEFCDKYFPGESGCVWQSMVFMLLPLHPAPYKERWDMKYGPVEKTHTGGEFRPYPDDIRPTEIEADIDYFSEGTEFEE